MKKSIVRALLPACLLLLGVAPGHAQRATPLAPPADPNSATTQANAGTVGLISGGIQGTYIRIAADLASVLDDGSRLRVLPIVGRGSVQNIADLLYLKGVDVGIVQADVLSYIEHERLFPNVQQSIQYVTKLYDEELHVLARGDVGSMADLAGKPVNVDGLGSGTAMTASVVFDALGVKPVMEHDNQATALQKLKNGEIAALVYVTGKPAGLFTSLPPNSGLHFLSIAMTPAMLETYLPARLEHAQYASLVPEDAPVETVAVGAVMAVYAWPRNNPRYDRVARFVNALFANIGKLRQPPAHPKWADVNLAAQLPGWSRFPAAQDLLRPASAQSARK